MKNTLMDRKRSKNYRQVSGHIPTQQYKEFKATCAFEEVTASQALEEAIGVWISSKKENNKKNG